MPNDHYEFLPVSSSHTEITNFLQGFVDNQINLDEDGSCSKQCTDYHETHHHRCQQNTICDNINYEKAKCEGTIRECRKIDEDVNICLSVSGLWFKR